MPYSRASCRIPAKSCGGLPLAGGYLSQRCIRSKETCGQPNHAAGHCTRRASVLLVLRSTSAKQPINDQPNSSLLLSYYCTSTLFLTFGSCRAARKQQQRHHHEHCRSRQDTQASIGPEDMARVPPPFPQGQSNVGAHSWHDTVPYCSWAARGTCTAHGRCITKVTTLLWLLVVVWYSQIYQLLPV